MSAKLVDYKSKYINDSLKQLRKGDTVFAISDRMKRNLDHAIDLEHLDITRSTCQGFWSYVLTKEEKK